jgi:Ala-tRNA(Pro) deacylase
MEMSTVTEFLKDHDVGFKEFEHPATFTAIEEARALGIGAELVAKTIVLWTRRGYTLAVLPASRRLSMRRVRSATDAGARLATEFEILRDVPGYELGAVPPVGSLLGLPMLVDPELAMHESVVFASGRPTESVQMRTADLLADRNATVVPLARPDDEEEGLFDPEN